VEAVREEEVKLQEVGFAKEVAFKPGVKERGIEKESIKKWLRSTKNFQLNFQSATTVKPIFQRMWYIATFGMAWVDGVVHQVLTHLEMDSVTRSQLS